MDGTVAIVFGSITVLSVIIGIIVMIQKSGKASGKLEEIVKTTAADVKDIKTDLTEIKIRNAAKDAEALQDKACMQKLESKVDEHDKDIHEIKGTVTFIKDKIEVKRTKAATL